MFGRSLLVWVCSVLCSTLVSAETLRDKTISRIFINKQSVVAFRYEPEQTLNNPGHCNINYLQLDSNAPFFKEQYSMLLSALATGKRLDIYVADQCSTFALVSWLELQQ